jgi:hypothetical protein
MSSIMFRGNPSLAWQGPPIVKFSYLFKYDFNTIIMGYFRLYNYESKTKLSSVAHASMPDDDTFVYYRRQEKIDSLA